MWNRNKDSYNEESRTKNIADGIIEGMSEAVTESRSFLDRRFGRRSSSPENRERVSDKTKKEINRSLSRAFAVVDFILDTRHFEGNNNPAWERKLDELSRIGVSTEQLMVRAISGWKNSFSYQTRYNAADDLLKLYYQQGRISDTLEQVDEYVRSLSMTANAEFIKIKCYNNHLSFVRNDIDKVKRQLEKVNDTANVDSHLNVSATKLRRMYIQTELKDTDIIKVFDLEKELSTLNGLPNPWSRTDIIESIYAKAELLERMISSGRLNEKLGELVKKCEARVAAMDGKIGEALCLAGILTSFFTDEKFDAMNPDDENSSVNRMNLEELIDFYRDFVDAVKENVTDKICGFPKNNDNQIREE